MKKIKFVFVLFMLLVSTSKVYAFDTTVKVYDYAMKLDSEQEEVLKEEVNKFIKKYNMDLVLVTVKYHETTTVSSYGQEFYNHNGFGVGNNASGLICVIDYSNKEIYYSIYAFGEANSIYNNKESLIIKKLSKEENAYNSFKLFIDEVNKYAKIGVSNNSNNKISFIELISSILISFGISTGIIFLTINKYKYNPKKNCYNDKLEITVRVDKFIATKTASIRRKG